jgi:SAM-dependent methyltransferase
MTGLSLREADPDLFQLGVQAWSDGDDEVLWHPITGRSLRLHRRSLAHLAARPEDPRLAPLRRRLDGLYLLRTSPRPDWPALVPCRSRLVLTLPDEASLWLPVPGFRGPGGRGYRAFRLSPDGWRVWQAINDSRTVADIASRTGLSLVAVQGLCAALATPELQALQLRDRPARAREPGLSRLVDVPRPPNARPDHLTGPAGETTLAWYHLHAIDDGETHFDDRETTVAHSLGLPHPALGGRRYGQALRDALVARRLPVEGRIAEVGCGTGELCAAWLEADPDAARRYLRVDLSPELLRTQARRAPATAGVLGDATRLPLRDGSIDLLLSNEVIADLQAIPVDPEAPAEEGPARAALDALDAYGLAPFPGPQWVNLGAWRFVAEIARVLAPGGAAFLSEFGVLDGPPPEAVQLDHPEVAIQVTWLARVARQHGLTVDVEPLPDLLGVDPAARHLARPSWHALRALARAHDVHLPARAWTPATLAPRLPTPVEGLRWVPLTDEGPGPLITRFWSWVLRKPRVPAPPSAS